MPSMQISSMAMLMCAPCDYDTRVSSWDTHVKLGHLDIVIEMCVWCLLLFVGGEDIKICVSRLIMKMIGLLSVTEML